MGIDLGLAWWVALYLIRRHEGLSLAPYFCPAGLLTIGYGHVILPHEQDLKAGITIDEAEALLLRDLAFAMAAARDVGRRLEDWQAAALASLIFNIGAQAWKDSTIRRLVVAGDMAGAAGQFGRWIKAKGKPLRGLIVRREEERRVFIGEGYAMD